ncbi:MAG: lytic murein transglycosylase B [Betaproteobacteria bacterium]|nr:lytic murein transglycosylase B [Betaproteobacteria bacterium]
MSHRRLAWGLALLLLSTDPAAGRDPAPPAYAQRADVRAFVDEMVEQHGFDRAGLRRVLAQARFQPQVVAAMQRPVLAPPKWYEYAPQFLNGPRIDAGVAFWNAHAATLARAEATFGVPPEVIVAILGVETFYGRNTGRYRVLDALATLAFDYPRRAPFFRGELRHFLLLARELSLSPLAPRGSFAGAMGIPQFMPGSYRSYAVDFDADGRSDLWASTDDVIGSVASYLARHDWQRGQPVLLPATIAAADSEAVLRRLDGGLSERRSAAAWANDGVRAADPPADLAADPVGLLLLEESDPAGETARYAIACHNFYVLTRYNRSRLYAAAVWELAVALKAARGSG